MMKRFCSALLLGAVLASSCQQGPKSTSEKTTHTEQQAFDTTIDGKEVKLYHIGNENVQVALTNYGARLVSIFVKNKEGKSTDVILGYDQATAFKENADNFYGAIVGRYGNRIGDATFTLNGEAYNLEKNDGKNSLHGGTNGLYNKVWTVENQSESTITLAYISPDGEAGYPGEVQMKVTYSVGKDGDLEIDYQGETNKETVLNLTSHAYFNLNGEGDATILDHVLQINADQVTEVNETLIPTGKQLPVEGTAFDFRKPKTIGADIEQQNRQLELGKGYDHNFVLNKADGLQEVASVYAPKTGIEMKILTTEPGLQFYSGNFMDANGPRGKQGKAYPFRAAMCLETQHFPDGPNQPAFPSTVLKPGEKYSSKTIYRFAVKP